MSSISVSEQRSALAAFFGTVAGITTVFERWPTEIQDSETPAIVLAVGSGRYFKGVSSFGTNELVIEREWTARVYAKRVVQGKEFVAEQAAEQFMTVIPDAIATTKRLKTSVSDGQRVFDLDIEGGSDSGVLSMTYNNHAYSGVEVTFTTATSEDIDATSI